MDFNFAYNKPNSFFKDKKAKIDRELSNGLDQTIAKDSIVTIERKSEQLKTFFNIVSDEGVTIYNVCCESLELIK